MAHNCELCDALCYCDLEDVGGLPQPSDCSHLDRCPEIFGGDEADDDYLMTEEEIEAQDAEDSIFDPEHPASTGF